MSRAQTTSPTDDLAPDLSDEDRAKARAGERAAMLQRLADIGMDMAEALAEELGERRRAKADEQTGERVSVADLSLAYNRVARAVRQTLALEARLEEGPLTRRPANDHADNNGFYPGSPKWAEWSAIQAKKIRAKIMTVALARTPEQRAAEDEAAVWAGYSDEDREALYDRAEIGDFIDMTPEEKTAILERAGRLARNREVFEEAMAEEAARAKAEGGDRKNATGPP